MKPAKLPKLDSIQKLARFWETHDITDFESDLEEVSEPVFARGIPIKFHLPTNEGRAVQRIARSKGMSKEALIHRWVKQKLAAERKS